MINPLVSVVVPVYNTEQYMLDVCFLSIQNQTHRNIELIIIDDGSISQVSDYLDDYCLKTNNASVEHIKNGGASVARNTGIELAKGEYITFVDADDWIESDFIELLLREFSDDTDIVMCTRKFEYKNGSNEDHFFDCDITFGNDNKRQLIVKSIISGVAGTWCKVYKKSFVEKNHLRYDISLRRTQDVIFNLHAFQQAGSIRYKNKCLYHYRKQNESITKKYNEKADVVLTKAAEAFRKFENRYYSSDAYIRECVNYKCINILNEIFKLKLFNPVHKSKIRNREVKALLKDSVYEEAIREYDMSKYPGVLGKIKFYLLRKNMIVALSLLYRLQYFIEKKRNY